MDKCSIDSFQLSITIIVQIPYDLCMGFILAGCLMTHLNSEVFNPLKLIDQMILTLKPNSQNQKSAESILRCPNYTPMFLFNKCLLLCVMTEIDNERPSLQNDKQGTHTPALPIQGVLQSRESYNPGSPTIQGVCQNLQETKQTIFNFQCKSYDSISNV